MGDGPKVYYPYIRSNDIFQDKPLYDSEQREMNNTLKIFSEIWYKADRDIYINIRIKEDR